MFRLARRLRINYFKSLSEYRSVCGINNNISTRRNYFYVADSDGEDLTIPIPEKTKENAKNVWLINSDEGEKSKDVHTQVPKSNVNINNTQFNNILMNDVIFYDDNLVDNKTKHETPKHETPKREINYFERDEGKLFKRTYYGAYYPVAFLNNIMFIIYDKQNKRIFYLDDFVPCDKRWTMSDKSEYFKILENNFNSVASYDDSYPNEKLFRCGPVIFNKTKLDKIVLLEVYVDDAKKRMISMMYHNHHGIQNLELQLEEKDFKELRDFFHLQKRK